MLGEIVRKWNGFGEEPENLFLEFAPIRRWDGVTKRENLGDGVVLVEFHNDDTDSWENGQYSVERRYVIDPIWEGTAPTSRCADALTADARMVEGAIVRVPATGHTTMVLDDIYGEV